MSVTVSSRGCSMFLLCITPCGSPLFVHPVRFSSVMRICMQSTPKKRICNYEPPEALLCSDFQTAQVWSTACFCKIEIFTILCILYILFIIKCLYHYFNMSYNFNNHWILQVHRINVGQPVWKITSFFFSVKSISQNVSVGFTVPHQQWFPFQTKLCTKTRVNYPNMLKKMKEI